MIDHVQISLQVLNVMADTITFAARMSAASVSDHWTPGTSWSTIPRPGGTVTCSLNRTGDVIDAQISPDCTVSTYLKYTKLCAQ